MSVTLIGLINRIGCLELIECLGATAVGPFAQARDAAQGEEEEERADSNLRKVTIESRKKGVASSTKMDFIRLRNDSYKALILKHYAIHTA